MYSSTTLKGPSETGCWKMLDYAESGDQGLFPLEYRSYLGQAAHAVLQYCAERRTETEADIRKTAEEVGDMLISKGRNFRGLQEPPLPADDVWEGVDVAVAYLMARGLPLDADALIPERDWEHPSMPFRALIDLVAVSDEGDEEYGARVVTVTDYKSSWQADGDELDTLQRWGQAVCVWRGIQDHHEGLDDIDIIRQSVVNLRTWQECTRDIHLDDPDAEYTVADLERWERRINSLCMTAHHTRDGGTGPRPASPGVGCMSCAWRHVCEDAWFEGQASGDLATKLAIVEGQRSLLIKAIKESDPEGPIAFQGGWVGFKEQPKRIFKSGSERGILDEWLSRTACELPEEDMPVLVSLLSALNLGKGNLDALAKRLMPERKKGIAQVRAEYVESLTVEKRSAQFGVWEDEK